MDLELLPLSARSQQHFSLFGQHAILSFNRRAASTTLTISHTGLQVFWHGIISRGASRDPREEKPNPAQKSRQSPTRNLSLQNRAPARLLGEGYHSKLTLLQNSSQGPILCRKRPCVSSSILTSSTTTLNLLFVLRTGFTPESHCTLEKTLEGPMRTCPG